MASIHSIYGAKLIEQHHRKARTLVSKGPEFIAKTSDMVYHNKLRTGCTLRIIWAKHKLSLVVYCVYRLYPDQFMAQNRFEYGFGKLMRRPIDWCSSATVLKEFDWSIIFAVSMTISCF